MRLTICDENIYFYKTIEPQRVERKIILLTNINSKIYKDQKLTLISHIPHN